MTHTRPAYWSSRENTLTILRPGLNDAIGGHQDRAGEIREISLLVLPRTAVIADEVLKCLELRVRVSGQHFAVSVDVDASAFRQFEQCAQIAKVVSRHKDRYTGNGGNTRRAGLLLPEAARIGLVKQLHYLEVHTTELQRLHQHRVGVDRRRGQESKRGLDTGVYLVAFLAQHLCVIRVSTHPLKAVDDQRTQPDNIGAHCLEVRVDAYRTRLLEQAGEIACRPPRGRPGQYSLRLLSHVRNGP